MSEALLTVSVETVVAAKDDKGGRATMLGLAAASMIYVAVADLIPGLHKRTEMKATIQQVVLIALGVASIELGHHLVEAFIPGV